MIKRIFSSILPTGVIIKSMLLLCIMAFAGCSTLNVKQQETGIRNIINLINSGKSEKLVSLSKIPFLFDSEIVLLQKDIILIWDGLAQAGFTIEDPKVDTIEYINEESYSLFSPAMEVRVYFKKHLQDKAILTKVSAKNGSYYFLTGDNKNGFVTIFGMKGPVQ